MEPMQFARCPIWLVLLLSSLGSLAWAKSETASSLIWTVVRADCDFRILRHQADQPGHLEDTTSEHLRVRASAGTYIYLQRDLPKARVLDDLQLGLWLKSDRRGLQIFGRIVLPKTIDPKTGKPLHVLLPGGFYEHVGQWQLVHLVDTPKELLRQRRILRAERKIPIDLQGAYLDGVVVNVFGGPGTTEAWLGEAVQRGRVSPDATPLPSEVAVVDYQQPVDLPPPEHVGTRLLVNQRPFFPLVIEHNGESWELLREMGFNTVYLRESPTAEQLSEAKQTGLWIICPPPPNHHPELPTQAPILAWHCGDDRVPQEVRSARLERLRQRPGPARPLIGMANENQWQTSRELDILLRQCLPLGTTFELSNFGPWLQQRTRLARPGTPFWTVIQTQLPDSLAGQVHGLLRYPSPVPRRVQVEQVRQLTLAAVAAGSRGLWFQSDCSLEDANPDQAWRRWLLERVVAELSLVEPWAMGGRQLGTITGTQPSVRVESLTTERSRLLITTDQQKGSQFVVPPQQDGNTLIIPGVPDSTVVYVLTPVELMTAKHARISGGVRIDLDFETSMALLVLTEDPLVVTHLNRVIRTLRPRMVELEQQLADQMLRDFEQLKARELLNRPEWVREWDAARMALQTCRKLSDSGDYAAAYRFGRRSQRLVAQLEAEVWQKSAGVWDHPLVIPMGASFPMTTLGHISTRRALAARATGENLLAEGHCEDLDAMIEVGWRQYQSSPRDVETYIALSPDEPKEGEHSLRLVARGKTDDARQSIVETPTLWVHSAPIPVEPGEQLEITGWVRIREPIAGSLEGLMIRESLGGDVLSLRFVEPSPEWKPFRMIRAVEQPDHLTISFALTGLGEAWLDDLRVTIKNSK